MKDICLAAAMVFLCVSGASVASAATGEAKEEPKKEKKICKTERVTGSLARRNRICLTRAEWDELARQTKDNVDRFQNRTGTTVQGAGQAGGPG